VQTELTFIFGVACVILLWRCSAKLSTIIRMFESIQLKPSELANDSSDLHALAAHFVPRLRTEADIANEHHYSEMVQMGIDRESEYFQKLNEKVG
jgi:hypothetical protein